MSREHGVFTRIKDVVTAPFRAFDEWEMKQARREEEGLPRYRQLRTIPDSELNPTELQQRNQLVLRRFTESLTNSVVNQRPIP